MANAGAHGGVERGLVAASVSAPSRAAPVVGDIWSTSWDQTDLGPVLVAAVRPTYVMAWPTTSDFDLAIAPALLLDGREVGLSQRSALWPSAECGAGLFLLDRLLGRVDSPRTVTEARAAIHGVGELPEAVFAPDTHEPSRLAALRAVVEAAQRIADVAWPAAIPGEGVLAREAIDRHGLTARSLAALLPGVPPGQVSAIAAQERAPTPAQATALAEHINADLSELLEAPDWPEVDVLDHPSWKSRIRALSAARSAPERTTRNLVVAGAAQAARQTATRQDPAAVEARVEAALRRLESGIE